MKHRLITSNENMPILEGVSYVDAVGSLSEWWTGLQYARDYAANTSEEL